MDVCGCIGLRGIINNSSYILYWLDRITGSVSSWVCVDNSTD